MQIYLTDRQIFDLELILNGGFSPLRGFLGKEDYKSVVENMHLASGEFWPMPIVLDVPEGNYEIGQKINLRDNFGRALAHITVSSIYSPDKEKEAEFVYGTKSLEHPGVRYLMQHTHPVYLGGEVQALEAMGKKDFHHLRKSPEELKTYFKEKGFQKVIGFQTRNPIHKAHYTLIKKAAENHGAHVLIHPVVGLTQDGDIDYITRIKCYEIIHKNYTSGFSSLSLLPLAMRMAGPREALWHALVRKNYGCTHFIVGRDHAGPKDFNGNSFYGPYEAQEFAKKYQDKLGIEIVPFNEMVYHSEKNEYLPINEVEGEDKIKNISGTEFRRMLRGREEVPEWFSFPEVISELRTSVAREDDRGFTIFFTGLAGAGKSTIAYELYGKLLERSNKKISYLDGDLVRQHLSRGLGFSREDRNANIERIGFVVSEITKHGGIAICSAIAPYAEGRAKNRANISKHGTYIEVHVSTPKELCISRDQKGIFKDSKWGDDSYEVPESPEIVLDTTKLSPEESAEVIFNYLKEKTLVS